MPLLGTTAITAGERRQTALAPGTIPPRKECNGMSAQRNRDRLAEEGHARGLSRRALLRLLATGAGTAAGAGILAACGGSVATPTAASSTPPTAIQAGSGATPSAGVAPAPTGVGGGNIAPTGVVAAPTSGASGGQVSIHWPKPITFNPLFTTAGSDQGVERLLFGALVKVNDKLEPLPDIAEAIDVSPDAKTYTFKLKKTLKFTDGTPLTAKDVIFTCERAVDKRVGSPWRGRLLLLEGATEYGAQQATTISGLSAPDDYTVEMTLRNPDATWLLTLRDFAGLGILPAHILKDVLPDQLNQHPFSLNPAVSAGVFQFGKYATDQFLELKRNDAYGADKAKLDSVFFKLLTTDAALAQLSRGELDLMVVPVSEVARLKQNPDLTIVSVPKPKRR